jgi:hypothetical protein
VGEAIKKAGGEKPPAFFISKIQGYYREAETVFLL